jgi:hypothetical protein
MKLTLPLLLLLSGIAANSQAQILNVDYMLRGHLYAKSSIKDSEAPGGFGSSSNVAKKISKDKQFPKEMLSLLVDTGEIVPYGKDYTGYKLYIANRLNDNVKLNAADCRLTAIAEASINGTWQHIEYLPSSWCGNSYHQVYLKSGELWEFVVPRLDGKIPTKIRYKLRLDDGSYIYSNAFSARINEGQLTNKHGHSPTGIMDSYTD